MARWGGARADWLDLSTGINPVPYPVPDLPLDVWTALPDHGAMDRLLDAARAFWQVPEGAGIVAAGGASAIIAALPRAIAQMQELAAPTDHWTKGEVCIPQPTYNEHAAAFAAQGWKVHSDARARVHVVVNPNNPDGRIWDSVGPAGWTIIDESFCDVMPERSHMARATLDGCVILKSFGKFWGLAGIRLGFAACPPEMAVRLRDLLGPWAVSGPALEIGARALEDPEWAQEARARLARDAARLDALMAAKGARLAGGTTLFRLYDVPDARDWHDRLARRHILSRIFPYSDRWLRLGLPAPHAFDRVACAL